MVDVDLKNILNSVGIGIIELDQNLKVSFCNEAWLKITGHKYEDCVNRSFSSFITTGSVSILKNSLFSNQSNLPYQSLWIRDSKNEIWPISFSINVGEDKRSWILELYDPERLEKKSKTADLYFETDHNGVITSITADVFNTLHYTVEECLNRHYSFLYESPQQRSLVDDELMSKGEIRNHRDYMLNKKGEKVYVIEKLEKILDENDQYAGFSCIVKYFTVSDSESEMYKEYNDRYIKFWDLTNEGLILHKGGMVLDVNSRIEKMLGYPKEELVGGYVIDLVVKEEWKEVVLGKIVTEDSSPYEIEGIRKNGEVFPVELESRNFLFNGEEVRVTAVRDLTDRRSEGKLIDREKVLELLENSTDRKTGVKYFESVILNISRLLRADMVFIGRIDHSKSEVTTLATCVSGILTDNINYELEDTPCENVVRGNICSYVDDVYKLFPKDVSLQKDKFRGYVGVELKDSHGNPIGILVSLFKRKLLNIDFAETVSKVFSHRLESELERTLIEHELKRSTNMLKLVLNNIPVNVYWKDRNLNYLGGNQSFIQDAGFKEESEMMGKTDYDMPWKEEADIYAVSDKSVLKKGTAQLNEEEPQTLSTGNMRWVRTSKVPMKNEDGETIGLLGISEDITEKKLIESSIRESENRFRNLAENIPGVIYSCQYDNNCAFIYLNENIKNLTGYSKPQFIEEQIHYNDLIHQEDISFVRDQKKMAVHSQTAYQIQYRIKHKDGSWKWIEESGVGVYEGEELLHLEGVMMDVTSRVESDRLVKESETKLRLLVENLNGVFWITNLANRELDYISPQYETIWERPISKIYQTPGDFLESIHPKDKDRVLQKFKKMERGEPFDDVYRIICENGKVKTIWVNSSLYQDINTGESKIFGYAEDITDKANIEKTLEESEIKFKTLIENLEGVTYILDLDKKKVEYVSPQYEDIWKRKCEDFYNDPFDFLKVVHPDDMHILEDNMKKVDQGINVTQVFRIIVDNQIKTISGKVNYLKEKVGDTKKIIGYSEDATASENAKKEIEKLALVSQKTNNAIIITDRDCKVEWINNAFTKFTGYEIEDVKNAYIQDYLYGPGTSDENITRLNVAIENRMNVKVETVLNSIKGQNRWVELNVNPVFDAKGHFEKFFAVMIDITDRKVSEEAIRNQNKELIKTNQELDNFVYRVSHDLKAPISSAKGLINIMKLEKERSNLDACVNRIEESMDKLDSFILDILDYSRNSRFKLEPTIVDLKEEADNVLNELKYLPNSDAIQKSVKVSGNMNFYSDKRRIKFILNNLISNAIRFSDPKKDNQKIEIEIDVNEKEAIIKCQDNGIGIEKEYLDRIFEMFFRATEVKSGSGLGLYIVKEAVDKLKGKIKVDSQIDRGSTFTVYLQNMKEGATE